MKAPYQPPREPGSYKLRGNNNALLTLSLFLEPSQSALASQRSAAETPVFSLSDRPDYVSARLTFLAERDPTGVKWAEKWLDGVNHLNRLMNAEWFRDAFEVWVEELEAILRSDAIQKIQDISEGGTPAAFQAAKYLAGREWKKRTAGRPSKAEVDGAVKREAARLSAEEQDFQRISRPDLKVVK